MGTILIGYDNEKMGRWAMAADATGPTPSHTEWLSDTIEEVGCNGMRMAGSTSKRSTRTMDIFVLLNIDRTANSNIPEPKLMVRAQVNGVSTMSTVASAVYWNMITGTS